MMDGYVENLLDEIFHNNNWQLFNTYINIYVCVCVFMYIISLKKENKAWRREKTIDGSKDNEMFL